MTVRLDPLAWVVPLLAAALGGVAGGADSLVVRIVAGAGTVIAALVAVERASRWATSRIDVEPGRITVRTGRLHPRRDVLEAAAVRAIALEPQSVLDLARGRGTLVLHHDSGRQRFGPVRRARAARSAIERTLFG